MLALSFPYHIPHTAYRIQLFGYTLRLLASVGFILLLVLFSAPAIAHAEELTIDATVAADPSDFQLSLSAVPADYVVGNQAATYTLTYGWLGTNPTDIMVVQVQWDLSQTSDNQLIEVLRYQSGSATSALNGTPPQIDVVNRTITWNIAPVPVGGDHTVTFQLLPRLLAADLLPLQVVVRARLIGPGITLPWVTLTQQYLLAPPPTPTPSPSVAPTPTAAPTPIVTPSIIPTGPTIIPTTPPEGPGAGGQPTFQRVIEEVIRSLERLANQGGGAIALPAVVLIAIPWLTSWITLLTSLLPHLSWWQLLSLLGAAFWRRRRHAWGVVYDAITKEPLDPAVLTLTSDTGKSFQAVSDLYGRYQFLVEPGTYYLNVNKSHYRFPSEKLQGQIADEVYDQLYFGGPITMPEAGSIQFNIPLDPTLPDWNQNEKQHRGFVRRIGLYPWRAWLFGLGFVWSAIMLLLQPVLANILVFSLYTILVLLYLVYRWQRPWGLVRDQHGRPLAGAVVTLHDVDHPQLKRPPVVTKASGRYAFLVGRGNYELSVARKQRNGQYWSVASTNTIHINSDEGHIGRDITVKSEGQ